MASPQLVETDVFLLLNYIKANLPQALSDVIADSALKVSNVSAPREYFFYDHVAGFQPPAVFVVPTSMDMRLQNGQNSVDALTRINVTALVEDKDVQTLTVVAWRYQRALFKILALARIVSSDKRVKIAVKIDRFDFSPVYTDAQQKGNPAGAYRMEVLVSCEVEHYEALP